VPGGDRTPEDGGRRAHGDDAVLIASAGALRGPVGQLHPQSWMTAPETRAVIEALAIGGCEVRFIGGCVRDALLKRPVKDIDLALALPPQAMLERLEAAGIRAIPTGIAHGTITAVVGAMHFEITSLRRDIETYGRHAKVAFTDDWAADAARRDFTINALSCTADGRIFDYFDGLDDLGAGRIRFVGDASERISEDALRLLRFFRFYACYGRPPADSDALAACRARATDIRRLSGERVRGELLRILGAADPVDVLQLMRDDEVLGEVLPEAGGLDRLRHLVWLECSALAMPSVRPDPTRRLAALIEQDGGAAAAVADRLRFSNRERLRLTHAVDTRFAFDPEGDPVAVQRALHHRGPEQTRDRALLTWAGERTTTPRLPRARTEAWLRVLASIDSWQPKRFPLRGRDAVALGVPHGPRIGALLAEIEAWWEDGGYAADHDACLARLRHRLGESTGPAIRAGE
jgi:poly(A) polymerase